MTIVKKSFKLLLYGCCTCHVMFLQIWAASELSGHAAAAKQEDHEEAEGGAQ